MLKGTVLHVNMVNRFIERFIRENSLYIHVSVLIFAPQIDNSNCPLIGSIDSNKSNAETSKSIS